MRGALDRERVEPPSLRERLRERLLERRRGIGSVQVTDCHQKLYAQFVDGPSCTGFILSRAALESGAIYVGLKTLVVRVSLGVVPLTDCCLCDRCADLATWILGLSVGLPTQKPCMSRSGYGAITGYEYCCKRVTPARLGRAHTCARATLGISADSLWRLRNSVPLRFSSRFYQIVFAQMRALIKPTATTH